MRARKLPSSATMDLPADEQARGTSAGTALLRLSSTTHGCKRVKAFSTRRSRQDIRGYAKPQNKQSALKATLNDRRMKGGEGVFPSPFPARYPRIREATKQTERIEGASQLPDPPTAKLLHQLPLKAQPGQRRRNLGAGAGMTLRSLSSGQERRSEAARREIRQCSYDR